MSDFEMVMKAIDENTAKLRLTANEAERQALLKRLNKLLAQADRLISVSLRAKGSH
jgi:Mg2+/Co2+ transporter CorB